MVRFLADENLKGALIRGLLRRKPSLDLVRVQDVGLSGADDPTVLVWAANDNRILLTHDVRTITKYAYERVRAGLRMPGILEINAFVALGVAIEDILTFAECSFEGELEHEIRYIPFK